MNPTRALLPIVLVLLAGCSSSRTERRVPPRFTIEEVPAAIEESEADLEAGRYEEALERLRSAKNTPGLPAGPRQEVQVVLERAARAVIEHSDDHRHLEELMDVDIPRPLAVAAGIRAARLLYAEGERMRSFRLIRRLDSKFPQHPQRLEAAALLFEIGENLANDDRRYLLFFRYKADAPQVLEYLVTNHPSSPRGDRALALLARLYVEEKQLELAIEKHQNLLLWYPDSPRAARSQAAIPHLRLTRLHSPEYDRSEMQRAREELEEWLDEHAGRADAELTEQVRRDRLDAIRRLADNDLDVARFYDTVDWPHAARRHARRAHELALAGGDPEQIEETDALLASLAVEAQPLGAADGDAQ